MSDSRVKERTKFVELSGARCSATSMETARSNLLSTSNDLFRSTFQNDVPRIPEHPERDRHMIGPTYLAGLQIIIEIFIGWRKQEIVVDSDHNSAGCCLLDQLGALLGSDRHRLFQQDMQAPLDQGRCRAGMEVGRQENVSCVESEFPVFEHRIQRLVRSGDTIYGCRNAWARDRSLSRTATNETPGIVLSALACQSAA